MLMHIHCPQCKKWFHATKIGLAKNGSKRWKDVNTNKISCGNVCIACRRRNQRKYRKTNKNKHTRAYEKTKRGFLMRAYRNMKSRVSGVQKIKFHLYRGIELMNKDEFYSWSVRSKRFHSLFKEWQASGYNRKLTPSVDRINPLLGYNTNNCEWVTHSENSRRGALSKPKGK